MNIDENKLPENSYICIQAFMVNDLHLKGIEKEVYALIYGFCQDRQSEFSGSLSYIQNWVTSSRPTVIKAISELLNKGLIIKVSDTRNPKSCNRYKINFEVIAGLKNSESTSKETLPVKNEEKKHDGSFTSKNSLLVENACQNLLKNFTSKNVDTTSKNSLPVTSKETLLNNINNNINNINFNTSTKNFTFSIPTLDDVLKYAKTFGENLYIDGDYFYYCNDKHNWKDNNGCQIRNWKALFNNWNKLQKNKVFVKQNKEETRKRNKELKFKKICERNDYNAKVYREKAVKTTNLTCTSCGKSYPDPSISFFVQDNSMHCNECNTSWIAATKEPKHQSV